jgi:sortase A
MLLEAPPVHIGGRMPRTAVSPAAPYQRFLPSERLPVWRLDTSERVPVWQLDAVLLRAQQLLLVGALLAAGYWFVEGPIYDWLHRPGEASADRQPPHLARALQASAGDGAQKLTTQWLPIAQGPAPFVPEATQIPPTLAPTPLPTPTPIVVPTLEPLPPPGVEPNHLIIPAIGVDTPVVEVFVVDDEWEVAEYAAGYMHGTARAGEPGNMGIMGHLGLRGGVFANLPALQPGADIFVDAAGQRYHYRMRQSQVVWPTQLEVLYPEEMPTLTLITCANWDTQRLVVTADLIEVGPIG